MTQNCPALGTHPGALWRTLGMLAVVVVVVSACQPSAPPPTATVPAPTARPTPEPTVEHQPIAGGPVLLRDNIELRKVIRVGSGSIRLARNPITGEMYYLNPGEGLYQVKLTPPTNTSK